MPHPPSEGVSELSRHIRGFSSETPLGAVLAGGAGSRLGGGKAGAELGGRPLVSYPLAALAGAGIEAVVCAKAGTRLPPLEVPVIEEPERPRHPLCGIVAALRQAAAGRGGARPVLVVACDLPFVTPELLALLASAPEPLVMTSVDGRPQPLLARYDGSLLPALEAALESEASLTRTVESLRPRLLTEPDLAPYGDPAHLLFNLNTPEDFHRAERLLPLTRRRA